MSPTFVSFLLSTSVLLSLSRAQSAFPASSLSSARSLLLGARDIPGYHYNACYTESTTGRALSGHSYYDDLMTVEKCALACSDFENFGVEYHRECFCGDFFNAGSLPTYEAECSFDCPGDSTRKCGAGVRLNVYTKMENVDTPTIPEVPASSSSSTSSSESASSSTTTSIATSSESSNSESTSTTTSESSSQTSSESITSSSESTSSSEIPSSSYISTTSFTTSEEPISTTTSDTPSSTTTSITTSSLDSSTTTTTTTTTTSCSAPSTLAAVPDTCWASMPTVCASLTRTPSIPWPAVTPLASQCRQAFAEATGINSAVIGCFASVNSPVFKAASAYSCIQQAAVFCQKVDGTCDENGLPTKPAQTNAVIDGSFEQGNLGAWKLSSVLTPTAIKVTVSNEISYNGDYSLKTVYDNTNGASNTYMQQIKLQPGIPYVASWRWYSINAGASTVVKVQFSGGGVGWIKDGSTINKAVGSWVQETQTFVSGASFGSVYLSVYGNKGAAPNTFFVDDFTILPVI